MSSTTHDAPLEQLIERLKQGDVTAAEQLLVAFEPQLRLLVRRQLSPDLQAKFDSVDVVQSVWANLLDGFRGGRWQFRDAQQLRAFLLRATQNRFIDQVRKHRQASRRERPLDQPSTSDEPAAARPSPTENVRAAEMWDRLVALCPEQHRWLLELKRQGFSLAEIAARTGLHESSVRRILYDLARRFALDESDCS
jgi:RNA polymerase sigma factor (sigma-70 family)